MTLPRLLDTATVAEHLGMSQSWVRANAHQLGGTRVGKAIRYDASRVRALVDQGRITRDEPKPRRRPGPARGTGAIPADVRDW